MAQRSLRSSRARCSAAAASSCGTAAGRGGAATGVTRSAASRSLASCSGAQRFGRSGLRSGFVGLTLCLASGLGCAGHSELTRGARTALDAGRADDALALLNKRLDVETEEQLPASLSGDAALFLLDRAMVQQQRRQFELSSRDLEAADKAVELLDFSRQGADALAQYLFSDDSGPYRAPLYEKGMINAANMLNYLERRDLSGARVEARRFAIVRSSAGDISHGPPMALGSYLAGFVFEQSGRVNEALRYYDEALQARELLTFEPSIARLSRRGSYRSPRLSSLQERHPEAPEAEGGALLLVVNYGRVPAKVAKRVPIGLALTYAADAISPRNIARAQRLAAQGLVTWVNYPSLDEAPGTIALPLAELDGVGVPLGLAVDTEAEARRAWESVRGATIGSAVTRLLSRLAVGQAAKKAAGDGLLGALLSLGTQAGLTAADTPDTRSWATLPARTALARLQLAPGEHSVSLTWGGLTRRVHFEMPAEGWMVVGLTVLRR